VLSEVPTQPEDGVVYPFSSARCADESSVTFRAAGYKRPLILHAHEHEFPLAPHARCFLTAVACRQLGAALTVCRKRTIRSLSNPGYSFLQKSELGIEHQVSFWHNAGPIGGTKAQNLYSAIQFAIRSGILTDIGVGGEGEK